MTAAAKVSRRGKNAFDIQCDEGKSYQQPYNSRAARTPDIIVARQ